MGRRLLAAAALVLASLLSSVATASAALTEVTEYGVGSIGTPHALVVDGGGNLWFSEGDLGAIGRVTPQGQITSYSEGLEGADPAGLIVGPGGDIWFGLEVDNSRSYIGRIAPTGAITLDQLPIARTQPERLDVGPEGNVWFISSRYSFPSIGYVTPLGAVAQFELPRRPLSLAAGAGANMWFTAGEEGGAAIGDVVLTEGGGATVTLVRSGLSAGSRPEELIPGPDGNLWFTDEATESIGQVTPGGQITELPIGSRAEQIVPGAEGNLWIRSPSGLSRATTAGTATYVENQPAEGRQLRDIVVGPEGDLWFAAEQATEYLVTNGTVGRVTPGGKATGYSDDLPAGSQPEEIVSGAGGALWFADRGTVPAIGRIVPGEDPEPAPPSRPSPGAGAPTLPGPSPSTGPGSVSLAVRHLSVGRGGAMRMLVKCAGGRSCAGRLTLTTVVHRPGKRASIQPAIATRKFSLAGGAAVWLTVQLTRRGRNLLQAGHGRLRTVATFSGSFSQLDRPTVTSVLLRSAGPRPR